jgi:hypothetical protein
LLINFKQKLDAILIGLMYFFDQLLVFEEVAVNHRG